MIDIFERYREAFPVAPSRMDNIERASKRLEALPAGEISKTLHAMLNGMNSDSSAEGQTSFEHVRQQVAAKIVEADDLNELAAQFDEFLKRMVANGGGSSGPSSQSSSRKGKGSRNSSAGSVKQSPRTSVNRAVEFVPGIYRNDTKTEVPIRDGNLCVLTGRSDFIPGTNERLGFQTAHLIPHSILKYPALHNFIKSIVPWLPQDFFQHIDSCENAIFLNMEAHRLFGNFKWFIIMDENEDPKLNVYRASQVEANGLLETDFTGRKPTIIMADGTEKKTSSFNQPLFIGTHESCARPSKFFCRLHELVARIIHLRGGAEFYQDESDDEFEYFDPIRYEEPMPFGEKVNYLLFGSNETLQIDENSNLL